jgi:hypothetical protein
MAKSRKKAGLNTTGRGRRPGHGKAVLTSEHRQRWLAIFRNWERTYPAVGNLVYGIKPRFPNIARADKPIEWGLMLCYAFRVLGLIAKNDPDAAERERQQIEMEHPELTNKYGIDSDPQNVNARMNSVYKALGMGPSGDKSARVKAAPGFACSELDIEQLAAFFADEIWLRKPRSLTQPSFERLFREILRDARPYAMERFRKMLSSSVAMPPELAHNMLAWSEQDVSEK